MVFYPLDTRDKVDRFEQFVGDGGDPWIMVVHSSGCPHCVRMMPAYIDAAERSDVLFAAYDVGNLQPQPEQVLLSQLVSQINSVPFILGCSKNGKKHVYARNERTADNFVAFARDMAGEDEDAAFVRRLPESMDLYDD